MSCPQCDVRLEIPGAAEGKKIRCKSCGAKFVARPAARESHDDDQPTKAARSRHYDDDEDDRPRKPVKDRDRDDDEDRPRSRRRPRDDDDFDDEPQRKKKGIPVLLVLLLVGGLFVVLAGGAVAAWWYFGSEDKKPTGPTTTVQSKTDEVAANTKVLDNLGWITYTSPDGSFRARFPRAPEVQNVGPTKVYKVETLNTVLLVIIADSGGSNDLSAATAGFIQSFGGVVKEQKDVTHQSYPAKELTIIKTVGRGPLAQSHQTVVRMVIAKGKVFTISVSEKQPPWQAAQASAFIGAVSIR